MLTVLAFLGRYATLMLAFGVFIGFAFPSLAALVRPWLALFIIGPLVVALMRIDWSEIWAYTKRLPLIVVLCTWMLVASPVLVFLTLNGSDVAPGVIAGIVLMAAAPPIVSAATIAMFMGLDGAVIIVTTVASMWLIPLILPPMALNLLDLHLDIPLWLFMGRLALLVSVAFAAAWIGRRLLGPVRLAKAKTHLDGAAVVMMLFFVVGVFDGVTEMTFAEPRHVLIATVLGFVFNIGLQIVSAAIFWRLGRKIALSVGLMAGNCNMGLVLVTLADKADADTAMFFAVGQLPMYILPALLTPFYRRLIAAEPRKETA
jgi:BASS family bile acid:Na+ symporter